MESSKLVAIDCEMVGVGSRIIYGLRGRDILARVSLVDGDGNCILDKYVKPSEPVMNYRTSVSGIRKRDLENGESFSTVQAQVAEIIKGKILIGHSLDCDLGVLDMTHPKKNIRDTTTYPPFLKMNNGRKPSLKFLARFILKKRIQRGEHSSVEDARSVMQVYKAVADKWEKMYDDENNY